ncbi:MAG: regulatory protein RecX [Eubacterium sp.]|nr:regulatory protein RecX [Eubacterium sp.]
MSLLSIKKKDKAFSVYENGDYLGFIYKSDLDKVGLDKSEADDIEVDDETIDKVKDIVKYHAFDKAVTYLKDFDRSAEDIKLKLRMKKYPDYAIEEAVKLLYEYNYLNDERFAESYIRAYMDQKSKSLILKELSMKHVKVSYPDELIDRVYAEEDMTEDKAIARLMRRFEGRDMTDEKVRRRAASLLIRHGFSFEQINNHLT